MDGVIKLVKHKFHHSHDKKDDTIEEPLSDSVKNLLELSIGPDSQHSKVFTVGDEFKLTEEMKQTFRQCEKNHRVQLAGFFPEGAAEAQILEEAPYHILKVNKALTRSEQTQPTPPSPKETPKLDRSRKINAMRKELQDSWGDVEFNNEKLSKFKKPTPSKLK